jgi:CubicO group peptidase (beta-lactamase class C family)
MSRLPSCRLLCVALLGLLLGCHTTEPTQSTLEQPNYSQASDRGVGDQELLKILSDKRASTGIPALSAAIVTSRGLVRVAAIGTRKAGMDVPVTLDDLWHIGSCAKIMTSTLVARLVEQGRLSWTTTVAEIFPDLADGFDPSARSMTILQLLSHAAGLPRDIDFDSISTSIPIRAQRIEVLKIGLRSKPLSVPGTTFFYSNLGYVIVGAIVEKVLDMDWEAAVTQYVFMPLKMSSAGFGGLGTPGEIDQPWGHESANLPYTQNGPDADLPKVLGPAGLVHCTIQDWALFIADQLRGSRGKQGLLKPQSYRMLQTTHFGGTYALGWGAAWDIAAFGKKLNHAGSNNWYYAKVVAAPARDFAILVCTNEGGGPGKPAISTPAVEDITMRAISIAGRLKRK